MFGITITLSTETALKLAPVAVALLAIAVTLWIRWNARRVRVKVEIREAWRPRSRPIGAVGGKVIERPEGQPDIFDGSVVLTNLGERSVYVKGLGIELLTEPVYGYDDSQTVGRREVKPHGDSTSLSINEEVIGFDLRVGFRGYAELSGEKKPRWTKKFIPEPPPDDVRWEDPPGRAP